jgi:aminomethyltransferase
MTERLDYWIRKSPFFAATQRHGCRHYAVSNHMYQPGGYDDALAEYWKLVTGVVLWDVATERQVEIAGPDAFAFTNFLTPRDLAKCPVGGCRYIVVTTEAGGIVNDPVLLRLAEDRFWLSCSDSDLLLWAKGVAVGGGFDVAIREPDVSPLQVQGPKSPAVIEALFGREMRDLRWYRHAEASLDGIPLVLTRTGWSGQLGYEVFLCDGRRGEDLWNAILEAGRPHGIAPAAPSDIARVEAGILGYGADMTIENNPFELGLERLVEPDQAADYIGKAALARIAAEGARQILVGIELDGGPLPGPFEARWPVTADGRPAGEATVAVHSPRLAKTIGNAMLERAHTALGTPLTVETPWGPVAAKVAERPFIAPIRS